VTRISMEEARQVLAEADCLYGPDSIPAAYDALAARIAAEYAALDPLILCVMKGGLVPAAEIFKRLEFAFEFDYLHATRYRGATSGGGLEWRVRPNPASIAGRHLLVIDDILDEGYTLAAIRSELMQLGPASLKVAVFVEKLHDRRAAGAEAEFVGVQVPDRYVFGSGMDYKEYWRQLPGIYAVKGL